jgi:hypothetical protein
MRIASSSAENEKVAISLPEAARASARYADEAASRGLVTKWAVALDAAMKRSEAIRVCM